MNVSRRIQVYVFNALWICLGAYKASISFSPLARNLWIILSFLGFISMVNILLKRNYLEIDDLHLRLNRDFFQTQTLELKDILKINIEPNPFTSSYILMKDGRKVKFNDSYISAKKLREVMGRVNIVVS